MIIYVIIYNWHIYLTNHKTYKKMKKPIAFLSLFLMCLIFAQSASAQLLITVYIKKNCPQCTSEIKKMKEAGLALKIKNVDISPQAKAEVVKELGGKQYLDIKYFPVLLMSDAQTGFSGYAYYEVADFAISTSRGENEDDIEKTDENMPPDYPDDVLNDTNEKKEDNNTNNASNTSNNPIAKEMVERHNYWRAKLGIGPVVWSDKLASYAQAWANELAKQGCAFEHRPRDGKWKQIYGENLYMIGGGSAKPKDVVDSWASEQKDFDFKTLECKGEWYVCGHYTQIIWENSTEIGCAFVKCNGQEIWVCNYNPPGNYNGQKPYKKK